MATRSARELVRSWRAHMEEEHGPGWMAVMMAAWDRDRPGWQTATLTVRGKDGEVLGEFVMFCRGGFEGEALPPGSLEDEP